MPPSRATKSSGPTGRRRGGRLYAEQLHADRQLRGCYSTYTSVSGGGAYGGTLNSCIVYLNQGPILFILAR